MRKDVDLASGRIQGSFERYVESLLLGPRPMVGKVQALLDDGVDIDDPMFTRAFARVQKHVLDNGIGTLAVLDDLVEVAMQGVR